MRHSRTAEGVAVTTSEAGIEAPGVWLDGVAQRVIRVDRLRDGGTTIFECEEGTLTLPRRINDRDRTPRWAPKEERKVVRSYVRSDRAWYAQANDIGPGHSVAAEIVLAQGTQEDFACGQDAPQIEVVAEWRDWGDGSQWACRVGIWDESWQALVWWRDLWGRLAAYSDERGGMKGDSTIDPDDFEAILKELGFEDRTVEREGDDA